ncbi:mycofactocin precursor MftA [Flexivirga lutea]
MATEEVELETADPAESNVDEVVADDLVEDVSIDGMCGVY